MSLSQKLRGDERGLSIFPGWPQAEVEHGLASFLYDPYIGITLRQRQKIHFANIRSGTITEEVASRL